MGGIAANVFASIWAAGLNLIFVPIYVRLLGMEAYGLIGFFSAAQVTLSVLDLGLTPTATREMARYGPHADLAGEARSLMRTLEYVYWLAAVIIGLGVSLLAPWLAHHWAQPQNLSPASVQAAIATMGLLVGIQWPVSLYAGGLQGLHQQVRLAWLSSGMVVLRHGGAVLSLVLIGADISVFFSWQVAISALNTAAVAALLWRCAPPSLEPARFRPDLLRQCGRFAAGMSGISVTVVLLTQADKLILSHLLPLSVFGLYSLAWVVASGVTLLITPVFNAIFPGLSRLVAEGSDRELIRDYHRGCQVMVVAIAPAAVVVAAFARELLFLWTGSEAIAFDAHLLTTLLVIGTALGGLVSVPYALQLAHGWTRLTLGINLVGISALLPSVVLLAARFGAVGGGLCWLSLNAGYVLVVPVLMHRRFLKGERRRWYIDDVVRPLGPVLATTALSRWLLSPGLPPKLLLSGISVTWTLATLGAALCAPLVRTALLAGLRRLASAR